MSALPESARWPEVSKHAAGAQWIRDRFAKIRPGVVIRCTSCDLPMAEGDPFWGEDAPNGRFACSERCARIAASTPRTAAKRANVIELPRDRSAQIMGERDDEW
jgi:hypothetical protein